jgi:hypothetical protein
MERIRHRASYKPGFAYYKYKEFFGEEPRGLRDAEPRLPSQTIRNWVKSRQIAYAMAQSNLQLTLSSSGAGLLA